jgi:hypothetical protein
MASQKYEQMTLTMNFQTPPKQMVPSISSGLVFNSRVAFSSVENQYFKRAYKAPLPVGVRSAKSLKAAILEFRVKLEGVRTIVCKNALVAAQVDGGKSITKLKLFAFVIVASGVPFLHEMFNTKLERLDSEYYTDNLTRVMTEFKESGTFYVSITMDNEASMNAGTRDGIKHVQCLRHLFHFCCGAHTLELTVGLGQYILFRRLGCWSNQMACVRPNGLRLSFRSTGGVAGLTAQAVGGPHGKMPESCLLLPYHGALDSGGGRSRQPVGTSL